MSKGISAKSKAIKKAIKEPKGSKEESKREFHLEVLQVKDIPKDLNIITEANIFKAVIYPLTPAQFYSRFFAKRALIIKGGRKTRFSHIVKTQMYDLDVEQICENTASEKMHIWFPNKNSKIEDKQIKSFGTEETELAVTAFQRGGASLYFGSSLEFRNLYCKQLTYQMGMNFGAYFTDFSTMGEIETFWSRKGNLTDFHTDF